MTFPSLLQVEKHLSLYTLILILATWAISVNPVYSQVEIRGKVIDKNTNEFIPYCTIRLDETNNGTISNELGEFVFKVDSIPVMLEFSHTSYQPTKHLMTQSTEEQIIRLSPSIVELKEVTVIGSTKDQYAIDLAKKAYSKIKKLKSNEFYGKSFYRQKSKNNDQYVELAEIFYDTRFNRDGIQEMEVLEGRYALNDNAIKNKNFTIWSRLLQASQPPTENVIFPLTSRLEKYYAPFLTKVIKANNQQIAVVSFDPHESVSIPAFSGEVYIDQKTYDVLKVVGNIQNDDLNMVQLQGTDATWQNYEVRYQINFKNNQKRDALLIDFIKVDQKFDYQSNEILTPVNTSSILTFFEYYEPPKKKRLGGKLNFRKSDWNTLDQIGYNRKFWEDNPIIKRTPIEEEVIESFEKSGVFGTIFLNSNEQIAIEHSKLTDDPFAQEFLKKNNEYLAKSPVEKAYVQFDKSIYISGENAWFSAWVVEGPEHYPTEYSEVVHIDLINDNNDLITSQQVRLKKGWGSGNFKLPEGLLDGQYQFKAYTNWMRNYSTDFFFSKTIKVVAEDRISTTVDKKEVKLDLKFFPEGGHLVHNLNGQVAFKAIGPDGLAREVEGKIINEEGKTITIFKSLYQGMGTFFLKPIQGENYTAIIKNSDLVFKLPEITPQGYSMYAKNLSSRSVQLKIQTSTGLIGKPFYVSGQVRGRLHYLSKFIPKDSKPISIEVPKNKMPTGILTITLFDSLGYPHSERIVFVNNQQELVISAKTEKSQFDSRDKIDLSLLVTDSEGKPISTNVSLSITDADIIKEDELGQNIVSTLLLQSDVRGYIENPQSYFNNPKRKDLFSLDLLMLTQGWRKYNWESVWNSHYQLDSRVERGLTVSGIVVRKKENTPLTQGFITMIPREGENAFFGSGKTSDLGEFRFDDIHIVDTTQTYFIGRDTKGNPVDIEVLFSRYKSPLHKFLKSSHSFDIESPLDFEGKSKTNLQINRANDLDTNVIDLEEVIIEGKIPKPEQVLRPYNLKPDNTYYPPQDKTYPDMANLFTQMNMPEVNVNRNFISIRYGGPPLIVVDGLPIMPDFSSDPNNQFAQPVTTFNHIDALIAPSNVDRIEILKGSAAAIYGVRGGNGVVFIYSKKGVQQQLKSPNGINQYQVSGYKVNKEFYSPNYEVVSGDIFPDYRTTLYWNPAVRTDSEGQANVTFYNSDEATKLRVNIQGLSTQGVPGSFQEEFGK